jgi:SAM-dependent methyltransferase
MRQLRKQLKTRLPVRYHQPLERAFNHVQALAYRGDQVYCPWCRRSFRTFVTYYFEGQPTSERYCPTCHMFNRHRLLWFYFQQNPALLADIDHLLHFAPETRIAHELQRRYRPRRYTTVDFALPMVKLRNDIMHLALIDQCVDRILCNHVLEHVFDDQQAIRELYRVLQPGGIAIITVPMNGLMTTDEDPTLADPRERERRFRQHDHLRLYGADIVQRLETTGFQVEIAIPGRTMSQGMISRYAISPAECIFLCRRY